MSFMLFEERARHTEDIWNLEVGDFLYTENIGAYSTASSPDRSRDNGFDGAKILHKKSPASVPLAHEEGTGQSLKLTQ
jgi:hypothetical protein